MKLTQMHVYWSQQLNCYFNKSNPEKQILYERNSQQMQNPPLHAVGPHLDDIISHSTN